MKSRKKLELSRETLRHLKSELPSDKLVSVRGGAGTGGSTCPHECVEKITQLIAGTLIGKECFDPA